MKATLCGICAVLEEVEWSHNGLKRYATGLERYTQAVQVRRPSTAGFVRPMPGRTGVFPVLHIYSQQLSIKLVSSAA